MLGNEIRRLRAHSIEDLGTECVFSRNWSQRKRDETVHDELQQERAM